MIPFTNGQEWRRFLKFSVVGAFGAMVDFGVMNLTTHYLNISLVSAGTISFICAVCSNFIWNRYWTYPDSRSRPIIRQLVMFFIVNTAGVAIRIPILLTLEPRFKQLFDTLPSTSEVSVLLAKNFTLAIAVGIVLLWNFFVNRYWTYNDVDQIGQETPGEQ